MSIDSIGAATAAPATTDTGRTRAAQDFAALSQALQQGDLAAAQQAFATLQQDVPWVGRAASSQSTAGTTAGPVASSLQALGNALTSGDLAGAQQAFANLQQAHGGHHGHHRHADTQAQSAPAAVTPADSNGAVDTHA